VAGPEPGPVDRTFTSGTDVDAELEVTVVPRQGPDLNRVLDTALGASVTGSSVLVDDAAARPGAALDGDPGTAWLPADSDAVPRLAIGLPEATSVTGVQVTAPRKTLDRVAEVVVASPDGARHGVLSSSGSLSFAPLQARQFSVTFRLRADGGDADSPAFQEVALVGAHPHGSGIVQLECGSGPVVTIDGQSWQTGVSARASELVAGAPVDARVCATGQVHLPAGTHRLVASSTPALDVAAASLTTGPPAPGVAVPLEVPHWSSQGGTVQLTAGGGVLALVQGFNAGWQAEVDGHRLTSIRLDGWRQAWLVPRGVSGLAAVRFEPDKAHREGLALGALALLALLLLVGLPARKSALAASPAVQPSAVGRLLVPLLAAAILAGPAGVLAGLAGVWLANKGAVRVVLCGSVFLAVLVAIEAARPFGPWWVFALAQLVTVGLLAAATSSPAGVTRGEP
jgi:arabinofuranan 3-O-arabinosyltransferase